MRNIDIDTALARRAKRFVVWDLLIRHTTVVHSADVHSMAPPRPNRVQANRTILGVLEREENDDGNRDTDSITHIQSTG
jgi:hypothetical protein